MTTVRRLMVLGAVLAFVAVITRSPLLGDPQGADPLHRAKLPPDKTRNAAEQTLEKMAAAKFAQDGVLTYETKNGELLFAVKVQPKIDPTAAVPTDYAILIDTTASQAGPYYFLQKTALRAFLDRLPASDRVAIWDVNVKSRNLTGNFVEPKSDKAGAAAKEIENAVTMGAADLKTALNQVTNAFENRAQRRQAIIYVGDGMSTLNHLSAADRQKIATSMVERKIAFFPLPIGPSLDPLVIHGLSTSTGGVVLRLAEKENVEVTLKRFLASLQQPILYPETVQLPQGVAEAYPAKLPPLRGDASTLLVGRLKQPVAQFDYKISGRMDGRLIDTHKSEKVSPSTPDCYFLASIVDQWKGAKDSPALLRGDRTLVFAYEQMRVAHDELLTQARAALLRDKFDAAMGLYAQAAEMDPSDPEAGAGMKLVDQLRREKQNKQLAMADGARAAKKNQVQGGAQAGDKAKDDEMIQRLDQQRLIEEQRLALQTEEAIKQAQKDVQDKPEEALNRLKIMADAVRTNPVITAEVKQRLGQQLENEIRTTQTRSERLARDKAEREQLTANARARAEVQAQSEQRSATLRAASDQFNSLMRQARYDEAYRQAVRMQTDYPDSVYPVVDAFQSYYGRNIKEFTDIIAAKRDGFYKAMLLEDRSHIPFADEPPIAYPPPSFFETKPYRNWGELSARRIKRWGVSTFEDHPDNLKKAFELQQQLYQPTDRLRQGIDPGSQLKETLEFISKAHAIPIRINYRSFKDFASEEPEQVDQKKVQLAPVRNIALATVLTDLLNEVDADYIVRRDHVEVCHYQSQIAEKAVRAYAVADLVIPSVFGQQGGLGGGGGIGGGGIGGIGGGGIGGGGLGGGLGGGGLGGLGGGGLGGGGFGGGGFGGLGGGGLGGGGFGGLGGGGLGGGGFGGLGGGGLGGGGLGGGGYGGGLGGGGLGGGLGGGGIGGGGGGFGGQATGNFPQIRMFYAQELINLIRNVVGRRDEWYADPNAQNQGAGGGIGGGGQTTQFAGGSEDPNANNLFYYDPALSLVVKGTTRFIPRYSAPRKTQDAGAVNAKLDLGGGDDRKLAGNGGKKDDNDVASNKFERNPPRDGDKAKAKDDSQLAKNDNKAKDERQLAKNDNLDPKTIWNDALKYGLEKPGMCIAAAAFLAEFGKFDHAAEFLKAAIRQGVMARGWMFEAIASALEVSHGDPDEIDRAQLSVADLRPNDAVGYLGAAKALGKRGRWARALDFCKQSAALAPNLPQPYVQALDYARQAKDVPAMVWAAEGLLGRDWPAHREDLHQRALTKAFDLAGALATDGKTADAERLKQVEAAQHRRDLVIRVTWQGDADLDLIVDEPVGTQCSYRSRWTAGGGTLQADLAADRRVETYSVAEAFAGDYKLNVRRIWGQPVGGKATVEITHGKGTPGERIQRETVSLDQAQGLVVKLDKGRRVTLADVPSLDAVRQVVLDDSDVDEPPRSVQEQLQGLANPITLGMSSRFHGAVGRRIAPQQPVTARHDLDLAGHLADDIQRQVQSKLHDAALDRTTRLNLPKLPVIPGALE